MNQLIGKPDLDTATRLLAQQMIADAMSRHNVLETKIAYRKAKQKERDWISGLFRVGVGLLLIAATSILDPGPIERLLLIACGCWLTVGGGLATSAEYNDTMKVHGPALARFIATIIGAFRPSGRSP